MTSLISEENQDPYNVPMPDLTTQVLPMFKLLTKAILAAGFAICFSTLGAGEENKVYGSIIGYGFLLAGTVLFMANTVVTMVMANNPNVKSMVTAITTIGPFLGFALVLSGAIALISYYAPNIARGQISDAYGGLSNIFLILILTTLYMFNSGVNNEEYERTKTIHKVTGMSIYFIEVVEFVVLISIFIVLAFFTTDG